MGLDTLMNLLDKPRIGMRNAERALEKTGIAKTRPENFSLAGLQSRW